MATTLWYLMKSQTRGRRREARRWMAEDLRLRLALTFSEVGSYRESPDRIGRTSNERINKARAVLAHRTAALRTRDPALYATVMTLTWENLNKERALTPEQRHAHFMRQVDKLGIEQRRAERLERARRHRTKKTQSSPSEAIA